MSLVKIKGKAIRMRLSLVITYHMDHRAWRYKVMYVKFLETSRPDQLPLIVLCISNEARNLYRERVQCKMCSNELSLQVAVEGWHTRDVSELDRRDTVAL